jgi:hypothetical protein
MYLRLYFRGFVSVFCLITVLAIAPKGMAAEWTAEPAVTARHEYNDNIGLSIHPHSSVRGSFVTPSLDLGVNTPIWQLGGGVSATQRRYSGQAGLDSDDKGSRLSATYRTERNTWQLAATRSLYSLLSGDLNSPDTGIVQTQQQTLTQSVTPNWTWMYSETTQLQVQYLWSEVSYGDSQSVGLYDYRHQSATATVSYQISERNQVFATGGYSKFQVPFTGFESDTGNVQIGGTRNFSETMNATLQAGLRNTEAITRGGNPTYTRFTTTDANGQIVVMLIPDGGVTQDSRSQDTSVVYSGNIEKKFDNTNVRMSVSRALSPSASGGQAEVDTFNFSVSRNLTDRTVVYLNSYYYTTRGIEGNITNNDRTYYSVQPGATWQLSREWNAGLNYSYARVERDYEIESPYSNSVIFTLGYRPLKMSISR